MDIQTADIEVLFWKNVLFNFWGIDAELTKLNSEYDINFLARCKTGEFYVLKILRQNYPAWLMDAQIQAINHIISQNISPKVPKIIVSSDGAYYKSISDDSGCPRFVWVLEKLDGQCYAKVTPKTGSLAYSIGQTLAATAKALKSLKNPSLARNFKWNLMQANWIAKYINCLCQPSQKAYISEIIDEFDEVAPYLKSFEQQVIHNDANDYNILVTGSVSCNRKISGLIDLGDICVAPRICDLAIAAAYIVLDHPKPDYMLAKLVAGYHSTFALLPEEVDLIWRLLRMRLALSIVNSTLIALQKPDDPYVTVSQAPAWRFLEGHGLTEAMVTARLRAACEMPVVDGADRILQWLDQERGNFAPLLGFELNDVAVCSLSVEKSAIPRNPFELTKDEAINIGSKFNEVHPIWLGYYHEPRLIYTEPNFSLGPWKASDRRTVHIAVDIFAPSRSKLFAPLDGVVYAAEYRCKALDYGGLIILQHETPNKDSFFTIYGHLNPVFTEELEKGDLVHKGQQFGELGEPHNNGGWAPHVHFQLVLSIVDLGTDFPGVALPDDMYLWHKLCPNPAALLNLADERIFYNITNKNHILKDRQKYFGGNLSVSYNEPLMLVRGWRHHLFDEWGRPYLDAYNNVPHVGHSHPRIEAVAKDQLRRINSNTRYLHRAQTEFAKKLLSKLPEAFKVCYFVNSGSEANELALRLAREHTKTKGTITLDDSYFGNTTGNISISAYKFKKLKGTCQPDWVEIVPTPDDYRGIFKRSNPNRASRYADFIDASITRLINKGFGVSSFIAETFPSVGGQIIPPQGYLGLVYKKIRSVGGICIADEVQTGLGRLGSHYFAFEYQEVCPDIVVLGKPIGNGHPIGVVITTEEIAKSFDNGVEFFSTFGGSTLSCRLGKEVLEIIDDENLAKNAEIMGNQILIGLKKMQRKHASIGDVRGMGLFIGVELIEPDGTEASVLSKYVKNRMRDRRILIGSEGPKDNILKIRPPLTIDTDGVNMLLTVLDDILSEL